MATNLDEPEAEELWPRKDVDPEFDEMMRAAGVRVPTRSLDRPRVVVKPRPAWLAFLLSTWAALTGSVNRLLGRSRKPDDDDDELDAAWPVGWPPPFEPGEATIGGHRVQLATRSFDRPRHIAKRRPAWLAFLLRVVGARG